MSSADRTELGSRLFVGGLMAYATSITDFGLVLNVAAELAEYCTPEAGVQCVELFDDERDQRDALAQAATKVYLALAAGQRVLVTCAEGRNRSCAVAALVLHWQGLHLDHAIEYIRARRPRALTNLHLVRQLGSIRQPRAVSDRTMP